MRMQGLCCFGCKLCNRSLGVHEPKWTSHVKRPSDVARSITSSDTISSQSLCTNNYCTIAHILDEHVQSVTFHRLSNSRWPISETL